MGNDDTGLPHGHQNELLPQKRKRNQLYLQPTKFTDTPKDKNYLQCCQLLTIYKVVKGNSEIVKAADTND